MAVCTKCGGPHDSNYTTTDTCIVWLAGQVAALKAASQATSQATLPSPTCGASCRDPEFAGVSCVRDKHADSRHEGPSIKGWCTWLGDGPARVVDGFLLWPSSSGGEPRPGGGTRATVPAATVEPSLQTHVYEMISDGGRIASTIDGEPVPGSDTELLSVLAGAPVKPAPEEASAAEATMSREKPICGCGKQLETEPRIERHDWWQCVRYLAEQVAALKARLPAPVAMGCGRYMTPAWNCGQNGHLCVRCLVPAPAAPPVEQPCRSRHQVGYVSMGLPCFLCPAKAGEECVELPVEPAPEKPGRVCPAGCGKPDDEYRMRTGIPAIRWFSMKCSDAGYCLNPAPPVPDGEKPVKHTDLFEGISREQRDALVFGDPPAPSPAAVVEPTVQHGSGTIVIEQHGMSVPGSWPPSAPTVEPATAGTVSHEEARDHMAKIDGFLNPHPIGGHHRLNTAWYGLVRYIDQREAAEERETELREGRSRGYEELAKRDEQLRMMLGKSRDEIESLRASLSARVTEVAALREEVGRLKTTLETIASTDMRGSYDLGFADGVRSVKASAQPPVSQGAGTLRDMAHEWVGTRMCDALGDSPIHSGPCRHLTAILEQVDRSAEARGRASATPVVKP